MTQTRPPSLVKIEDAAIGYSRNLILQNVNLEIREGEYWFFLGPNGVGKTSLLRVLLGTLSLKSGQLRRALAGREIGFVPQSCKLNSSIPTTVREFVSLGLVGLKIPKKRQKVQLQQALEKAALDGMVEKSYHSLSGGQKQRALVARALIRSPKLLILDEPTTGLDVRAEMNFMRTLEELNKNDKLSIILVSHNLSLATSHAKHVALFLENSIQTGRAQKMLTNSLLASVFKISGHKALKTGATTRNKIFKPK